MSLLNKFLCGGHSASAAVNFLLRRPSRFSLPMIQYRTYWQEIIRVSIDPQTGKKKYEDPGNAALRSRRAQNAEGLLRRRFKYLEYEKPWMKKKRLKNERIYKRKLQGVEELKTYIKFMQKHSDDKKEEDENDGNERSGTSSRGGGRI